MASKPHKTHQQGVYSMISFVFHDIKMPSREIFIEENSAQTEVGSTLLHPNADVLHMCKALGANLCTGRAIRYIQ